MGLSLDARDATVRHSGGGCGGVGAAAASRADHGIDGARARAAAGLRMSRTAQLAVNAAGNYGRMLVQIASVAVLTPYVIARIGSDDFGLWSLVISTLGFLSLLDLGFGTGVVKYVAECYGSRDIQKRNRILSPLAPGSLAIPATSWRLHAALAVLFSPPSGIPTG